MTNIIECVDRAKDGSNTDLVTFKQVGSKRGINRKIIDIHEHIGDYGMGGPGFYGFLLSQTSEYDKEWLILRLWGAGTWLLFNGKRVENTGFKTNVNAWVVDDNIEIFRKLLIGNKIIDMDISTNYSILKMQKDSIDNILEIPKDTNLLSKYANNKNRTWFNSEDQRDAWIFSKEGKLYL